ncbi:MAG: DNA/RNA nuclease SfsA [Defluviitaleaceae bacterium]|nr:DNA/RNA nuclease SfsA [Defluviitaleaceae bacterium]
MTYKNIHKGIFLNRPNRFIAEVEVNGVVEICHVKNTGRCKELLTPNATVYVDYSDSPTRKTKYSLVAVQKGDILINMDSQAPNAAFKEFLLGGYFFDEPIAHIKPEAKYGNSRFDFYVETTSQRAFIEVKGVTLEENGVAMFPDAPTERGIKHLEELVQAISNRYEAYAVFIIQMKCCTHFTPNNKTHLAFGQTLAKVQQMGVKIFAFDCEISPSSMVVSNQIPIKISSSHS